MLQKLQRKGYDDAVAHAAVDAVYANGLQNDGRFAESFVRSRAARGQGPNRIRQELRVRGVSSEKAEAIMAEYDWDALIHHVYTHKYGKSQPESRAEHAARFRFLHQRGFTPSQINALFRRLRLNP